MSRADTVIFENSKPGTFNFAFNIAWLQSKREDGDAVYILIGVNH